MLTRRPVIETGRAFRHETSADWLVANTSRLRTRDSSEVRRPEFAAARWVERIVPAASLDCDGFDRRYVVNESLMPEFPVRPPQPPRSRLKEAIPQPLRATLGGLRRQTRLLLEQLLYRI